MTQTTTAPDALAEFLLSIPEPAALNVRSLVHAWESGGGTAIIGKVTVRLTGVGKGGNYTAAIVHPPRGERAEPELELSKVLLEQHGVDWTHWSDDFLDFATHGFDQSASYPKIRLDDKIVPGQLVRLVNGLRDLAAMVN